MSERRGTETFPTMLTLTVDCLLGIRLLLSLPADSFDSLTAALFRCGQPEALRPMPRLRAVTTPGGGNEELEDVDVDVEGG